MINQNNNQYDQSIYVCPTCKYQLEKNNGTLFCQICNVSYPIIDNIPDFILEDLSQNSNPTMRGVKSIDRLASIYESQWWYPFVLNLYGGWGCTSLEKLLEIIGKMLEQTVGRIIDVACGPGTFGRRIASPSKVVFGMDISMGMLRQGMEFAGKEGVNNIFFSRAKAEALPYKDNFFDAAICCGALHLFTNTVMVLQEISRTLKKGAPLAAFTFFAGEAGILRFHRIREHIQQDHGIQIFEIPEIKRHLMVAGFERFTPKLYGSVLVFSAIKNTAGSFDKTKIGIYKHEWW
jgi:SAM-dependent methyltransferase